MSSDFADEVAAQMTVTDKQALTRLAGAFKDAGLDPKDLGSVEKIKFYEGFHKDDDGEGHVVPMVSFQVNPSWAAGPQWPVVQPAPVAPVRPTKAKRTVLKSRWRTVVLPDMQIGGRLYIDGDQATVDPFQDEQAIAVALSVLRQVRPDRVILLGDNLDFPEFGKYEQEPEFQTTTQYAIDRAALVLDEIAANAPEAEVHWLEGNHERRLPKAIARNAMAAMRLKRGAAPDSWPVLSIPSLLDLDSRGVTYHDGYPAASVPITDEAVAVHGENVVSGGSTASKVARSSPVSVIFGHVHREEFHVHRWADPVAQTSRRIFAASPGCLCRIDGAVPGSNTATNGEGRAVIRTENWHQGLAVLTHGHTGQPDYERVPIEAGRAIYRDKEHQAP